MKPRLIASIVAALCPIPIGLHARTVDQLGAMGTACWFAMYCGDSINTNLLVWAQANGRAPK